MYYLIKDESWLPWYLGGSGSVISGMENMPFTQMNQSIYTFGLILLGYPVQLSITHFFFDERASDFAETSLHHITQLCLSSAYLYANTLPVGSIVSFLHDFSCIPVGASKGLHLSGYKMPTIIVFSIALVCWFTMRICCLPMIIWDLHSYQ